MPVLQCYALHKGIISSHFAKKGGGFYAFILKKNPYMYFLM